MVYIAQMHYLIKYGWKIPWCFELEGGGLKIILKWSDIQPLEDKTGREYLEFTERDTKTEQVKLLILERSDQNSTRLQMIIRTALLLHIRLFGIIDLLPPWPRLVSFYIVINHKRLQCSFNWYKNQPLGEHTVQLWEIWQNVLIYM